ncbi:MAG: hypothetical protein LBV51_02400 [Acholeplasmatales bacterium]|jgi:hypothetical protein|nr:hypothetical protein [Acholeplasmatales bacterium]
MDTIYRIASLFNLKKDSESDIYYGKIEGLDALLINERNGFSNAPFMFFHLDNELLKNELKEIKKNFSLLRKNGINYIKNDKTTVFINLFSLASLNVWGSMNEKSDQRIIETVKIVTSHLVNKNYQNSSTCKYCNTVLEDNDKEISVYAINALVIPCFIHKECLKQIEERNI